MSAGATTEDVPGIDELRVRIAITQGPTKVAVRSGENADRTLEHAHVVRAFATRPAALGRDSIELPLPDDFVTPGGRVVIFVDDTHGRVFGAAGAPLQ